MGIRFRKGINLGGGFRINLSKSGIGYSWGVKGYRLTKKVKGGTRQTATIPGTGISYVKETSGKTNKLSNVDKQLKNLKADNYTHVVEYENSQASELVSAGMEDIIVTANKSLKYDKFSTIGIVLGFFAGIIFKPLWITILLFVGMKLYVRKKGCIHLEYSIDNEQRKVIDERMMPLKKIAQSQNIWRIIEEKHVIDKKYSSGASASVNRTNCLASKKLPFPFKSNESVVVFNCKNEKFIFLPDKFFIIQNYKVGALDYTNLKTVVKGVRFVESKTVPSDAKVVDKTWKYVNKNGGGDKRFKDNEELPICLYGEMIISSNNGMNTVLMFSNIDIE